MINAIRRCHFRIAARRDRRADSGWAPQFTAIGKPEERVDCRRNRDTRCANQETRAQENGSTQARAAQGGRETDAASTPPDPPPAPKSVPEPKAEPLPKPKPKPKAKPAPPKPKPKPKEVKVASKTPPVPRPKRRPKPPRDEFQSLLKNLAKEQRHRKSDPPKKPQKIAKRAPEKQQRSPLEHRRIAGGLVQAIKQQITPCWKIQAGAKNAVKMQVAIRMRLNPDGSLGAVPQIQDQGRIGRDPFFRAVAESALRALRDPACVPIKLPYEHYDIWREIVFTFDPREALGQ